MASKVQRTAGVSAALALLFALGMAACGDGATAPTAASQDDFGAPYEIVLNDHPAEPDDPPALLEDTLAVRVRYTGGCEDHDFTLREASSGDTLRLWLFHDAHGDACEALLHDRILLPVSERARTAAPVYLLNPQGGPPFVLRWRP